MRAASKIRPGETKDICLDAGGRGDVGGFACVIAGAFAQLVVDNGGVQTRRAEMLRQQVQ